MNLSQLAELNCLMDDIRRERNRLIDCGKATEDVVAMEGYRRHIIDIGNIFLRLKNFSERAFVMENYEHLNFPFFDSNPASPDLIHYCLGFAFSPPPDEGRRNNILDWDIVLAEKKLGWQKGLVNGLGGKVNIQRESPIEAMVREFEEEAEIHTALDEWIAFGSISCSGNLPSNVKPYCVHCFVYELPEGIYSATFGNNRVLDFAEQKAFGIGYPMAIMLPNLIPNLQVLIPAALHTLSNSQVNCDETASMPQTHLVYTHPEF